MRAGLRRTGRPVRQGTAVAGTGALGWDGQMAIVGGRRRRARLRSSVRFRCGHDPAPPVDLFAAVGLGRHRDNDEWIRYADCAPDRCQECERAEEQLARIPLELDGRAVMDLLGIPAGPLVGAALRHLRQRSLAVGPLSRAQTEAELQQWERTLSG